MKRLTYRSKFIAEFFAKGMFPFIKRFHKRNRLDSVRLGTSRFGVTAPNANGDFISAADTCDVSRRNLHYGAHAFHVFVLIVLWLLSAFPTVVNATVLGDAAAALSPGQWVNFSASMGNLNATASYPAWDNSPPTDNPGANGGASAAPGPAYDGSQPGWNSATRKMYFQTTEHGRANPGFGGWCPEFFPAYPHGCWKPIWTYDTDTNQWDVGRSGTTPTAPFPNNSGTAVTGVHVWGGIAWDDGNQVLYVREQEQYPQQIHRFCAPTSPASYCAGQLGQYRPLPAYNGFPNGELLGQSLGFHRTFNGGTLLVFSPSGSTGGCAALAGYKEGTTGLNGTWTLIDNGAGCKFPNPNSTLMEGQYSTLKEVMVLSTGGTAMWRVTNTGAAQALDAAPCPVGTTNNNFATAAEDVNTGDIYFLLCGESNGNPQFWKLNPTGSPGSQWTPIDTNISGVGELCEGDSSLCTAHVYATPIRTYGVIGFWRFRSYGVAEYWLFKPSAGGGGDVTSPLVSLTAPAAGTVSGTVTVSATASDDVGVVGVQFKLDGNNIGSEDTSSPYSISWDSLTATNGSHTLTAFARDAAGNTTTSTGVSVTVSNPPPPGGNVLSVLADTMAADTWAVLNTPASCNTTSVLLESGSNIIKDASQGAYDPVAQQIHIIGIGSANAVRHVVYDLVTNTCSVRATPPWSTGAASNSYEYGPTIDARGRMLYRGRVGSLAIERYNLQTQAWLSAVTPGGAVSANASGFPANAFHYERGSAGQLVIAGLESGGNGVLYTFDPSNSTFARLNGGALLTGFVDFAAAEYSEVHKVTFFGGRGGTYRLVNTLGVISAVSTSGMNCQPGINRDGILHADPATGNFILLCGAGTSSWQVYNPIANTWTTKTAPASVSNHILQVVSPTGFGQTYGKIGIPLSNHGVILYIACDNGTDCQMRLYKGGTFTTAGRDFKNRCYAANVVYCNGFDSPNDISGNMSSLSNFAKIQSGDTTPVLDSSLGASGNSSIKFTQLPLSSANAGGNFTTDFSEDASRTFGKDDEFYFQYRIRWTPCYLYIGADDAACLANGLADNWANRRIYAINGANSGGFKLVSFNEGERPGHIDVSSHGDIALATQDTNQRGFLQHYWYDQFGVQSENPYVDNAEGFNLQWNNGQDGVHCLYQNPNPVYAEPGCVRFRAAQWMTIQYHFKPNGVWNTPGAGTFEMWIAQEGLPSKRVMRRDPAVGTGQSFGNKDPANSRFGIFILENYHTEKDPTQSNPLAFTYFDEVIISRSRIADPGAVASANPPVNVVLKIPASATGLKLGGAGAKLGTQ